MILPVIPITRREPTERATPRLLFTAAVMQQIPLTRIHDCLTAFHAGYWGRVSPAQAEANDLAAQCGGRMLAIYPIVRGARALGRDGQIWITRSSDALVFNVMLGTEYLC